MFEIIAGWSSLVARWARYKRIKKRESASITTNNLILEWAVRRETNVQNPVKFVEALSGGNPEPSSCLQENV